VEDTNWFPGNSTATTKVSVLFALSLALPERESVSLGKMEMHATAIIPESGCYNWIL